MQRVQHVCRCISESVHSLFTPDAEPFRGGKDAPRSGLRLVSGKVISLVIWGRLASRQTLCGFRVIGFGHIIPYLILQLGLKLAHLLILLFDDGDDFRVTLA